MSRAERLLRLLQCLRHHKHPVPGATLADELGVSLRTVYRDIAALQAQGAHIDGEAGIGYVLRPGFLLPPLMFTEPEIESLALGAQWVAKRGGSPLDQSACDALAKIFSVLPSRLRRRVSESTLLIGPTDAVPVSSDNQDVIYTAINREQKIFLHYQDENGKESSRVVWPFTLGFFERVQLLVAWCELRQSFRSFRTDRIMSVALLVELYPRSRNALFAEWRRLQGILEE